jgi:predicted aspartyl protease
VITGRVSKNGVRSALAAGRVVEEDAYSVEFPFDGQTCLAIATFVSDPQILIGTNLLRQHVLQIRFASKAVRLEREVSGMAASICSSTHSGEP